MMPAFHNGAPPLLPPAGEATALRVKCGLAAGSILVLASLAMGTPCRAQAFGVFGPSHRPHAAKRHKIVEEVPLPVPRPTFPGGVPPSKIQTHQAAAPPLRLPAPVPPPKPAPVAPLVPAPLPASHAAAGPAPAQPSDDPSCPGRLKTRHVTAETINIGPQPDARCTVVEAVRLTGMVLPDGGAVDFPDRPTVACVTADTFTRYIGELLSPLAKGTFGAPITAVWTGPGLECRSRDHIFGAKLSAHGQGLAVDIAQLKLGDARMLAVGAPTSPTDQAFETAARAGGCGYFHTVLGPGSDSYHRFHWHFDLEQRGAKGDAKFCQ